jgi:N6-adenosine-specific RNA methylase IME4
MTDLAALTVPGGWQVILADPPWSFASNSAERPGRNARRHYPCMPVWAISDLPVKEIAARDALLLLWATVPFAAEAVSVAEARGFRYVSQAVWVKARIGTGFWARNRHEPLLICRRGRFPCPPGGLFADSVHAEPAREHSRKPDFVHRAVEARLPQETRRLELFARAGRPGWAVWGNDVERFGVEA